MDETAFGDSRFGILAERFARFFGTPRFIIAQTIIVAIWIASNGYLVPRIVHGHAFDVYPFILLNLLFSTQAAYAAPLILLAQTRQAERDKASAEADAHHREDVANRQRKLIEENTDLTKIVKTNTDLLRELHRHVTAIGAHLGIAAGDFDPDEPLGDPFGDKPAGDPPGH
jgi:uncharacterized membrane protein